MTAYEKINGEWVLQGSQQWYAHFATHQTGLEIGRVLTDQEVKDMALAHGAVRFAALVDEVNSKTQIVLYFQEMANDLG